MCGFVLFLLFRFCCVCVCLGCLCCVAAKFCFVFVCCVLFVFVFVFVLGFVGRIMKSCINMQGGKRRLVVAWGRWLLLDTRAAEAVERASKEGHRWRRDTSRQLTFCSQMLGNVPLHQGRRRSRSGRETGLRRQACPPRGPEQRHCGRRRRCEHPSRIRDAGAARAWRNQTEKLLLMLLLLFLLFLLCLHLLFDLIALLPL